MPDVSPDDLTARLRELAFDRRVTSDEVAALRNSADRIDALSGDVARLEAERDGLRECWRDAEAAVVEFVAERDEALAQIVALLSLIEGGIFPGKGKRRDDAVAAAQALLAATEENPHG